MTAAMPLRVGTRGSPLALIQTRSFIDRLRAAHVDRVEEHVIRTTGDAVQDRRLAEIGGKGLFAKEIHEALTQGHIDLGFLRPPLRYPSGLTGTLIWKQPFIVAVPQDHPLARESRIRIASLADEHVQWLADTLVAAGAVEQVSLDPSTLTQRIAALNPSLVFVDFSGGDDDRRSDRRGAAHFSRSGDRNGIAKHDRCRRSDDSGTTSRCPVPATCHRLRRRRHGKLRRR